VIRFLHGEQKVAFSERLDFTRRLSFACFGVLGIISGLGVMGPIGAYIFSWCFVAVIGWFSMAATIGIPSLDVTLSLFEFGKYDFIASSVGAPLYSWTDTLLIGVFLTPAAVGAYELAWQISAAGLLLSKAISLVLFPAISSWASEGDFSKIEGVVPDAITGSLLLVAPVIMGVLLIGESILELIQSEYVLAATAFVILAVCRGFQALNSIAVRCLYGMGTPKYPAVAAVVFILINTILNIVLIPVFDLTGAALATLSAFFVNSAINWAAMAGRLEIRVPHREIAVIGLASSIMGAVLYGLLFISNLGLYIRVGGGIVIGATVYCSMLLLYRDFRKMFYKTIADYVS